MTSREIARHRGVVIVMRLQCGERASEIAAHFGRLAGGGFECEIFREHDEACAFACRLRDAIADARGECGEVGGFADRVLGRGDVEFHIVGSQPVEPDFPSPACGRQNGRIAVLHGAAARRASAMDGASVRAEGG